MRRLVLLAALVLVAGCQPDPFGRSPGELKREQESCEAEGGQWARGGLAGALICFRTLPDAGEACTRAGDCNGQCVVDYGTGKGQCQAVSPMFGCYEFFDETGKRSEICVD